MYLVDTLLDQVRYILTFAQSTVLSEVFATSCLCIQLINQSVMEVTESPKTHFFGMVSTGAELLGDLVALNAQRSLMWWTRGWLCENNI